MTKKELNNYIDNFSQLGKIMTSLGNGSVWPGFQIGCTQDEYENFEEIIEISKHHNGWFAKKFVQKSLFELGNELTISNLNNWLGNYQLIDKKESRVGVIMAGNIPLVGFHDLLCILLSGNIARIKMSSDDNILLPALIKLLFNFNPEFEKKIIFIDGKLDKIDAIIATGSNNTARYFHYYFGKYPNIIRKNRNSIAILDGNETKEEIHKLGNDIFDYFGLGCRNVTKLYFPKGYKIDIFFEGIFEFSEIVNQNKYANNYDYNKAVWLLNLENLLDNGFIILREDETIASATASLNYEYYDDISVLRDKLNTMEDQIQCIVSHDDIPFGDSQKPKLSDYADGVDTLKFLTEL